MLMKLTEGGKLKATEATFPILSQKVNGKSLIFFSKTCLRQILRRERHLKTFRDKFVHSFKRKKTSLSTTTIFLEIYNRCLKRGKK